MNPRNVSSQETPALRDPRAQSALTRKPERPLCLGAQHEADGPSLLEQAGNVGVRGRLW